MSRKVQVAIDGPAGAGKSSVARDVAAALGYTYVDSGAMYRAVAYRALRAGLEPGRDDDAIGDLAGRLGFEFRDTDGEQRLHVDNEDLSEVIRAPEVGNLSSPVSAIPQVRGHLLATQRDMAAGGGVIMEGRDIGTVVLPAAEVKVFLTASPEERARRRRDQLARGGITQDFAQILADIIARDERDSTRAVAPLKRAEDALEIVSEDMTKEQVVARIYEVVRRAEQEADG